MSNRSKLLLVSGAVLFFFAMAAFLWWPLPPPTASMRVSFLYLTNDTAGSRFAVLSITNERNSTLDFAVCEAQMKSADGWPAVKVPHVAGSMLGDYSATNACVLLPPFVSGSVWRVPVLWSYFPTGLEKVAGTVRYNWYLLVHGKKMSWNGTVIVDTSYSPEFVVP